MKRYKNYQDIM